MNLLPQNPKIRIITLIAGGGVALVFLVLFASGFFAEPDLLETAEHKEGLASRSIFDRLIKKLEDDVTKMEKELVNPFYGNLKKYQWSKDTATAGKANPFIK